MRSFGKWLGRILLVLLIAAICVGLWKREEITRLLAVNSLFDADKIVNNFSSMDSAFLSTPVPRGDGPVVPLNTGTAIALPNDAGDWVQDRQLTSLLVLHRGQIVFEEYFQGTSPEDRRISWSVAKSYLSALFGVLHAEGAFGSLDDPVVQYAPMLRGGAYDTATIRNVLQMSSGITFNEDYLDPKSDINRMGRILALGGTMDDFAAGLNESFAPPGQQWKYTSIDTHVLGMVIRGATGRSVADLLSEKILSKLGMEQDALYVTDGVGVAFVLGGLNITTRDYARFGLMIEQDGMWNGEQIVPADWIKESTTASAKTEPGAYGYGYQWWIPTGSQPGQFIGRGIYGQYLYIDQGRDVVIVMTSADRNFRDPGVDIGNIEMFRTIVEGIAQ